MFQEDDIYLSNTGKCVLKKMLQGYTFMRFVDVRMYKRLGNAIITDIPLIYITTFPVLYLY